MKDTALNITKRYKDHLKLKKEILNYCNKYKIKISLDHFLSYFQNIY